MALTFEIKSGKAVLSDPCYNLDMWCSAVVNNVKNGIWGVYVERGEYTKRNNNLMVYHTESFHRYPNILNNLKTAPPLPKLGGVDSGQFGIFDYDGYRNDESITSDVKLWSYPEKKGGDRFYLACCYLTIVTKDNYGVLPLGVVCASGWGDGSYELRGFKDSTGEYIGFLVIFIDEQVLDEEDDFWGDEYGDDEDEE